jgi:hypothetical protein
LEEENLGLLSQFERYVEDINRTYSNDLYSGLPKSHSLWALAWLLEAYITARDRPRSCQAVVHILQALGFHVDTNGLTVQKITFTPNSILSKDAFVVLNPLVGQAIEAQHYGNVAVAKHLLDFVKSLERVAHGTDTRTIEAYKHQMSELLGRSAAAIEMGMAELGL